MEKFELSARDNETIDQLLKEVAERTDSVEDPGFHRAATLLAHELPRELRRALADFRLDEPSGALLLSGFPIDDAALGPTPAHWDQAVGANSPAARAEIFLFLCAQLLGDPFAWATLHNGLLEHNIIPIKGHEAEQIASGSEAVLTWHTEEAFQEPRADYTALMCLRNPYGAPTTIADIGDVAIDPADLETLRQPLFLTRPSGSHARSSRSPRIPLPDHRRARTEAAHQRVDDLHKNPVIRSILFGSEDRPYLCVDPDCMTPANERADEALRRLRDEVTRKLHDVILEPGQIMFIDNYLAVHGRKPFKARFDGTDRWLKRLNIARDLRASRARRLAADDRVVY